MHVAGVVLMLGVYDGCIQVFTLCLCMSLYLSSLLLQL